ncbi:hypothetical protein O1611_g1720 [Lasiodiplodia mahajangana]|uniref:Uncharacterized protein n=1 Tax=Lasiodiplodia mahajangana TaxID=1108764 RepID=A0ACC2JX91_9PEZI|nr:hypothetical protein O1611_g1720 [Lasiodiplodia mahajangana]
MVKSRSIEAWAASVQQLAGLLVPSTSANSHHTKRQRETDNNSVTSTSTHGSSPLAKRQCRMESDNNPPLDSPLLKDVIIPMAPTEPTASLLRSGKRGRTAGGDSDIPSDVQSLVDDIWNSGTYLDKIIPFEVRESVAHHTKLRSTAFRDPCQEKAAEGAAELITLSGITAQAAVSQEYGRDEFGWNNHVYAPLLQHVFGSIPPNTENYLDEPRRDEPETDQPRVTARFEAVMSATIATNSIPYIIKAGERVPACSAHSSSQSETSTTSLQTSEHSYTQGIDYVVVMNIETDRDLHKVIRDTSQAASNKCGHANQTAYPSIRYRPIAVSIKTKAALFNRKDMAKLSLWVAAGHKRLYQLRDHLSPPPIPLYMDEATEGPPKPRLVTMPVIRVEGHSWDLYLACDKKTFISLIGPIRLGSTGNILQLYALVASLRHIKRWIETTFYDAMVTWFMQESLVSTESAGVAAQETAP